MKFAAWAEGVLSPLNDAQMQQMLNTEFGGMNEVLADLYADTGDRALARALAPVRAPRGPRPAEARRGSADGLHGNTQVPKLLGSAARYAYTGDRRRRSAATFFWDRVVEPPQLRDRRARQGRVLPRAGSVGQHHRRPHGGDLQRLQHAQADAAALRAAARRPVRRVPRARALQSHPRLDGSGDGTTCYMVPVGRGVRREYQDMLRSFTCCVGSGMESHALHGLRSLLRVGRSPLGEPVRAVDGDGRMPASRSTMATTFPEGESPRSR